MAGNAVVTTRLSSCAMNSATLVTTNVQTVRERELIGGLLRCISEYSLTLPVKKNQRTGRSHDGDRQALTQVAECCVASMAAITFINMPIATNCWSRSSST